MYPAKFRAITPFGDFTVRIVGGDFINVGGKNDCVQIFYDRFTNKARLERLETEKGGCSLSDEEVHGEKTIQMADLGFSILRDIHPSVEEATLIDSAKFPCTLPDGKKTPISYKQFFLLLKGKTYYQDRFQAIPEFPAEEEALHTFVKNREDPLRKPAKFNFMNADLNTLLTPVYDDCTTWKEFIEKLYSIYKRGICQVMYPWYLHAYSIIKDTEITTNWKIPLRTRPVIEFGKENTINKSNYTRKNITYDPTTFWGGSVYTISYKHIQSGNTRKTRKNRMRP